MKKIILSIFFGTLSFIVNAQVTNPIRKADINRISALADTLFDHQNYQAAYVAYDHLVSLEENNGKAYRRMGYIKSIDGQAPHAIELFKKAIAIDSTDKVSYYYLGTVYSDLVEQDKNTTIKAQNKAMAEINLKRALQLGYTYAKSAIDDLNKLTSSAKTNDTTVWTKDDSKIYGSKDEKQHQEMISHTSDNRFLSRFIGFKVFYLSNLSLYMQTNLNLSEDDLKVKSGIYTYVYSKKGAFIGNALPKKDYVIVNINKDERISQFKITGSLSDLANLFINYWPQEAIWASENQLKPGVSALKHCYGDLVSFKWNDGIPYILVSKDPNMTVPVKSDRFN